MNTPIKRPPEVIEAAVTEAKTYTMENSYTVAQQTAIYLRDALACAETELAEHERIVFSCGAKTVAGLKDSLIRQMQENNRLHLPAEYAHWDDFLNKVNQLKRDIAAERQLREKAEAERDTARREAERLCLCIFNRHYAKKEGQPPLELCDSVPGIISQIDNMVAGLFEDLLIERQRREKAEAGLLAANANSDGLTKTFEQWQQDANKLAAEFPNVEWSQVSDFVPLIRAERQRADSFDAIVGTLTRQNNEQANENAAERQRREADNKLLRAQNEAYANDSLRFSIGLNQERRRREKAEASVTSLTEMDREKSSKVDDLERRLEAMHQRAEKAETLEEFATNQAKEYLERAEKAERELAIEKEALRECEVREQDAISDGEAFERELAEARTWLDELLVIVRSWIGDFTDADMEYHTARRPYEGTDCDRGNAMLFLRRYDAALANDIRKDNAAQVAEDKEAEIGERMVGVAREAGKGTQ